MNNLNIYIEIGSNYLQFFEYEEKNLEKDKFIENLEINVNLSNSGNGFDTSTSARMIFWDHRFQKTEINYWSYLAFSNTRLHYSNIWKKFYDIKKIPLIVKGFLTVSDIIDIDEEIFSTKIICDEEIHIQSRKILVLENNSNLSEILNIPIN